MNSLVLVAAAAVAFIFGYRFYSKLLALGVLRLEKDYSTPVSAHRAEGEHDAASRHLAFGHHMAALAAGAAITGNLVSLIWGWVPAFLWAVVGTVIAAGTYGLGALWLSVRYPGLNPAEIATRCLGGSAHGLFALPIFFVLLVANAVCATLAAEVLCAHPSAALPFWFLAVLAILLGNFLRGREDFEVIPASLIALTLGVGGVWLLGKFPLSFTGALSLETAGAYFSFDATVAWVIILFAYGYHATRLPMWKLIQPRGYLTALLLAVMLFIFYTAVVIDHPNLVAPEFHRASDAPDIIPWLFVTLTSGAVAGFHLLIANGITARQMKHEADARYIGYGGALALGLLALSAILIGSAGFADAQEWNRHYASWENLKDLRRALDLYINGFAHFAAGIGLDQTFARALAAVLVLALVTATLEGGLRVQKQLLTGLAERYPHLVPGKERVLTALAVVLSAALALHDGRGRGGFVLWPLWGTADQILAVLGFALLAVALQRLERPVAPVLAPLFFLLASANWALALQMAQWWSGNDWILLGLGLILLVTELGVTLLALNLWRTPPKLDTGP